MILWKKKRRICQHLQSEHGNYYESSPSSSLFTFVKSTEAHTPWDTEIVMIVIQYRQQNITITIKVHI